MYTDLINSWRSHKDAVTTRGLYDVWRSNSVHMGMVTRLRRSLIHSTAAVGIVFS